MPDLPIKYTNVFVSTDHTTPENEKQILASMKHDAAMKIMEITEGQAFVLRVDTYIFDASSVFDRPQRIMFRKKFFILAQADHLFDHANNLDTHRNMTYEYECWKYDMKSGCMNEIYMASHIPHRT